MEPIAVIGIGCRFPGASGPEALWRLLRDGVDAITEVPPDRWDVSKLFDPDAARPGTMTTRWGGFLSDIDRFDAAFFGMAPREAAFVDPQQRLLLEVSWEALEDAGLVADRLAGGNTGVFVGVGTHDYSLLGWGQLEGIGPHTGTGTSASIAANRLSYFFDFKGPSVAVDTACSASLAAVHLACQSLWSGESGVALAGGVNAILLPVGTIGLSKAGAMAADGRCKTFDARADGYVRSEGAGVVVLKRLSRALADRDPIYATILGTAINADGRTNGLMAPNRWAQESVIREAWRRANVDPALAQYVEAHGTGTLLGDPIEAKALGAVMGAGRPADRPCAIGSIKSNIGHLEAAAGIAGLIKVALMLKARAIPPSLHFERPNPHIPFGRLSIRVASTLEPWPNSGRPLAGVSSFGFGGANAHVVLEGRAEPNGAEIGPGAPEGHARLLPVSARSPDALRALVQAHRERLATAAASPLRDVCYTAAVRRAHHEYRAAFVATTSSQLRDQIGLWLEAHASGESIEARRPGKLVFVFPGQGSQWAGMGRQLWNEEPVFRVSIERTARAFERLVAWGLRDVFEGTAQSATLDAIDVVQPVLFAIQVALAELWRSFGIEPDALVGHSMGEVAAAHVAGIISLDDAARIICRRSVLLKRKSGLGAMAVTEMTLAAARTGLEAFGSRLSVAACNGPRSTVVSGDTTAIDELLTALDREGTFARRVNVDVASHSPQMDDLRDELLSLLQGVRSAAPEVPFYSTVTGRREAAPDCGPHYWVRNLREPVLFAQAIDRLLADGYDGFLEVSAHPVLIPSLEDLCRDARPKPRLVASLRRDTDERMSLLTALAELYGAGQSVDWSRVSGETAEIVPLPMYPWQRERFWLTPPTPQPRPTGTEIEPCSGHPLLGRRFDPAGWPGTSCWQVALNDQRLAYLKDHRVDSGAVFPAAGYIELALAALSVDDEDQASSWVLEDVRFEHLLSVENDQFPEVQIALAREHDHATIRVLSSPAGRDGSRRDWTLHASLSARRSSSLAFETTPSGPVVDVARLQSAAVSRQAAADYYGRLERRGLRYGPAFRGVLDVWRGESGTLVRVALPEQAGNDDGYVLHPSLLDAVCFQALAAALTDPAARDAGTDLFLPVSLQSLHIDASTRGCVFAHARVTPDRPDVLERECDVDVFDAGGRRIGTARGVRVRRVVPSSKASKPAWADWLYAPSWQPSERGACQSLSNGRWVVCVDSAGTGDALVAALKARGDAVIQLRLGHTYAIESAGCYRIDPDRREDLIRALDDAFADRVPCAHVVYLWPLDDENPDHISSDLSERALTHGPIAALHLVQAVLRCGWRNAPRLSLITRSAHRLDPADAPPSPPQASLWGFGRVVAHEHPELRCTLIDLPATQESGEVQEILRELATDEREDQIALRRGGRFVARLVRQDSIACAAGSVPPPFRLTIEASGRLDRLRLVPLVRRELQPDEVEIEVVAAGLNFLDVLGAMGIRPDRRGETAAMGFEVSGRISRVGSAVTRVHPGEDVIALTKGAFASFAIARDLFVVPKPAAIEHADAATLPIAFVTAHYALNEVARLKAGERVLIHSASGATGLAAVQIARRAGAWIFGTAGSEAKRAYLRSLGLEGVGDSRSAGFVDDVMRASEGGGVDLVLNSLTGPLMEKSLGVLAPYGRFLEIGKRDIYNNATLSLLPFHKSLSYSAIDVASMADTRPALLADLLAAVVAMADRAEIVPLPRRVRPIERAEEGFREMAQARHIGKLVFDLPPVSRTGQLRSDVRAGYLITGGLGRLGLRVADWLGRTRGGSLVLVGRSAPTTESPDVQALRGMGIDVEIVRADVSRADEVSGLMRRIRDRRIVLKGVVHAAGVLDDGLLVGLDAARMRSVMAPKVLGAWNVHRATLDQPLDFFVLYSSAAAPLGSPGQANYAAANAFLDGLAQYRRALGRPALSIDWGPFALEGLAATADRGGRLALRGMESITPAQGIEVLAALVTTDITQLSVMSLNLRQWLQFYPRASESRLFERLVDAPTNEVSQSAAFGTRLAALEPAQRRAAVQALARSEVAQVIGRDQASIATSTPFSALGVDSLMALETRNRLESATGLTLPATLLWTYPDIDRLASHLARELGVALGDTPRSGTPAPSDLVDRIRDLSDAEVERMLASRFEARKQTT